MDKNLDFLTKQLVDEAVLVISKNGIPPKRKEDMRFLLEKKNTRSPKCPDSGMLL